MEVAFLVIADEFHLFKRGRSSIIICKKVVKIEGSQQTVKPKVYVTLPIPEDVEKYIAEHCEIRQWKGNKPITRENLLEEITEIEGLYTSGGKIDSELLDQAPNLKVVSNVSVGYNNFDLEAMKKRDVIGTNTPYILDETVADLTFGLILSAARRIAELDRIVKDGNWKPTKDDQSFFGIDVHGSTLGIIGMGRIGEAIAREQNLVLIWMFFTITEVENPKLKKSWGGTT